MVTVIGEVVLAVGQWPQVSPAMFAKVVFSEQSAEGLPVIVPIPVRVPVIIPIVTIVVPVVVPVMVTVIGEVVLIVGQWPRVSPAMFAKVVFSEQSAEGLPVNVPIPVKVPVIVPIVVPVLVPVQVVVMGEAVLAVGQWPRVRPVTFAKVIASE